MSKKQSKSILDTELFFGQTCTYPAESNKITKAGYPCIFLIAKKSKQITNEDVRLFCFH
jgi:hypothetical protein